MRCPIPISLVATRISTVSRVAEDGGVAGGAEGRKPASQAAVPPAASAIPSTRRRAAFIDFRLLYRTAGIAAPAAISPSKRQIRVNIAYRMHLIPPLRSAACRQIHAP